MEGIGEKANDSRWVGVEMEVIRRIRANRLDATKSPIVF